MPVFVVLGHTARTDPGFSLNDMPGGAGRMDVLCRAVNASLFLSHDMRRDVSCYLVLMGEPAPPVTILFEGRSLRSLNPDERSAGALVKKALAVPATPDLRRVSPGVFIRRGGLVELLPLHDFALLDEGGTDIRKLASLPGAYLLSDHLNLTEEEEDLTAACPRVSVGPRALHAEHAITAVLNEVDRRDAGWA